MIKISPSILSADFSRLGEQIERLDKSNVEMVHIDVMDGSFVPNISFGAPIMRSVRGYTKKIFDVHLMIEEPSRYIEDFVKAGADIITVHYEADKHIDRTINYIKSFGLKAGVAINPGTPISVLENIVGIVDMVLIMTVNPGFGGQKYISYCSEKIKAANQLRVNKNPELMIEVDGGVGVDNINSIVQCGANVIVAGSAVFKEDNIESNIKSLREALK